MRYSHRNGQRRNHKTSRQREKAENKKPRRKKGTECCTWFEVTSSHDHGESDRNPWPTFVPSVILSPPPLFHFVHSRVFLYFNSITFTLVIWEDLLSLGTWKRTSACHYCSYWSCRHCTLAVKTSECRYLRLQQCLTHDDQLQKCPIHDNHELNFSMQVPCCEKPFVSDILRQSEPR
jgi:hypothetical protein